MVFVFVGIELVGIIVVEIVDFECNLFKVINLILVCIIIFYVLVLIVIMVVILWC